MNKLKLNLSLLLAAIPPRAWRGGMGGGIKNAAVAASSSNKPALVPLVSPKAGTSGLVYTAAL